MGRKRLTDEERERFRTRLLDVALELFAKAGFEAVSIRSLADQLGCSAMTPYRYFDDKAAIFDACRARAFEAFAEAQEATAAKHTDPRNRVRALGQAYANFADRRPNEFRLMFELEQPAEPSEDLGLAERRAFATIRNAVSESVEAGYMRGDALTLAHMLWATLHGLVALDLNGKLVHGRAKRTLLKAFFDGIFSTV